MTIARYSESISIKTEILFTVLTEKTQSTLILENGSIYKVNNSPNEKKTVFVLKKSNRGN